MLKKFRDQRGQVVVLTALALFTFGMFSAISVDVGIAMVDRRDAQSDVDKAALAGALELTLENANATADEAAAEAAALEWAEKNGIDTTEPGLTLDIQAVETCYSVDDGVPTGVQVTLERDPDSFFLGFLDVDDWNIRVSATACAGRPIEMNGFLPFAISEVNDDCFTGPDDAREPKIGEVCDLVVDTSYQGSVGFLSVTDQGLCPETGSGAQELGDNIEFGVQVNCSVGDQVTSKQGHSVGQVRTSLMDRMAADGACEDALVSSDNYDAGNSALFGLVGQPVAAPSRTDNMDDFFETWAYDPTASHPAQNLLAYDCHAGTEGIQTSPRNVVVIIVHDYANPEHNGNKYDVQGFARVYIEGCTRSTGAYEKDCIWNGGGSQRFTIHARFVEQVGNTESNLGLDTTYGDIEVFLKQ